LTARRIRVTDHVALRAGKTVARAEGVSRLLSMSESGFSLVETLVALALLAGALLSLARMFTTATAVVTTARHITTGTILAAQKLEELRVIASGFPSGPKVSGGIEFIDRRGAAAASVTASGPITHTRQWWIRPLPADPDQVSVIQVLVTPGSVRAGTPDSQPRRADEVFLATIQARNQP
jgi:prepilin-type N-terminal cleavage/methylation domain-containing protein